MSFRISVAFALLMTSADAAAAQEMCGDPPLAPVIPSAADMRARTPAEAAAARHAAFADVRRWQGALKSYRDCLNATVSQEKRAAEENARSDKPDKDKLSKTNEEIAAINHAYDVSVDQEERVVNEFHAAQVAYCARKDVDISTCPKT